MEPRATANSDEDTEHISGWSLFFQGSIKGSVKAVLVTVLQLASAIWKFRMSEDDRNVNKKLVHCGVNYPYNKIYL